MGIQFVGGNTASKAGGTIGTSSIALDSGLTGGIASAVSAGDMVIAIFGTGDTANRTLAITDGANDYTLIDSELYVDDGGDTNLRVAYKFMGVTPDTATTFGPTGSVAAGGAMAVYVFRGVDPETPLDVVAVSTTGTNSVLANPPSIEPVTTGAFIVCVGAGAHGVGGAATYSSSDLTNFITISGDDSNDGIIGVGHKDDWTSGAFNAAAFTFSGADNVAYSWAAMSIALRPLPGLLSWAYQLPQVIRRRLVKPEGVATSAIDASSFAPPELIRTDKWFASWREPARRVTRRLGTIVDRIDISHPDVSGWTQPISTPTRRITRRYGEKLEAFDASSMGAYGWQQPLSLPAEPTRRIWTPDGRGLFTVDRIDISNPDVSGWGQPLALPVRRITRRYGEEIEAFDASSMGAYGWPQPLSLPVRRRWSPNGRTEFRDFVNTASPMVSGWFPPLTDPVRRIWGVNVRGDFATIGFDPETFQIEPVPEESWFHPLSIPVRRITRRYGIMVDRINPVGTAAPTFSWFHPFSLPTPLPLVQRRGRFPAHLRVGLLREIDPTPPLFASHWHRQWSEPRRFRRDPRANVVLMATAGGFWVTTGAYEPGPEEIMLSDQFAPFVYTAELHPWATGRD